MSFRIGVYYYTTGERGNHTIVRACSLLRGGNKRPNVVSRTCVCVWVFSAQSTYDPSLKLPSFHDRVRLERVGGIVVVVEGNITIVDFDN